MFHAVTMGPEAFRQPLPELTAEVLVNPLHQDEKALVRSFEFPRFLVPSSDVISEVLASCFYHADTLNVTRIAFPLLGTGGGGFPQDVCLDTIFRYLCRTFGRGMTCVREGRIVLFPDGN